MRERMKLSLIYWIRAKMIYVIAICLWPCFIPCFYPSYQRGCNLLPSDLNCERKASSSQGRDIAKYYIRHKLCLDNQIQREKTNFKLLPSQAWVLLLLPLNICGTGTSNNSHPLALSETQGMAILVCLFGSALSQACFKFDGACNTSSCSNRRNSKAPRLPIM